VRAVEGIRAELDDSLTAPGGCPRGLPQGVVSERWDRRWLLAYHLDAPVPVYNVYAVLLRLTPVTPSPRPNCIDRGAAHVSALRLAGPVLSEAAYQSASLATRA
jgi:hypothetical protein